MITIYRIFEMYGIDPSQVKLIRHGNKEIPIRETFTANLQRLEAYQSFQKPGKFGKAKSIVVFAPHYKTTAIFLGIWDIQGCTDNSEFSKETLSVLKKHNLPESWYYDAARYHLEKNDVMDDLSERLVIEWGAATVAWVQSMDKDVVELRGRNTIGDFQSFEQICLNFRDVELMVQHPDTNITWVKALSSVNGVYLIRDTCSGKLYVGSAYGNQGIYGRWAAYTRDGHGGNLELRDLDPKVFEFSILEIVPATTTAEGVIDYENRWKNKLGTRKFGLNKN